MVHAFRKVRLSPSNNEKLRTVNAIIQEYADSGYKLTLRQLYYQLVSRDIIPNVTSEYAKLSKLLKEGRMGGIVDWDAIEDRLRVPYLPYFNRNVKDAIEDTIEQYRLDRMKGQDTYLEVWVEKDALSGVLKRVTQQYHVRLLVSRGYNSVTAIHDAYNRISHKLKFHSSAKILYLGDHDPSGVDMVRDIQSRIGEMLGSRNVTNFSVEAIALTTQQIKLYKPPPNPTKKTDPRSKDYLKKHGNTSWEVDALNPQILNALLADEIEYCTDMDVWEYAVKKEEEGKDKLRELMKHL